MLNVSIVNSEVEFDQMQQEWTHLLHESDTDTVFMTWEWGRAWWKSYSAGRTLFIVKIRDELGTVAIVPLYLKRFKKFGLRYTGAYFVGDGTSDSDYLDAIVRKGMEQQVAHTLVTLFREGSLGDLWFLNDVPKTSAVFEYVNRQVSPTPWTWRQIEVPCTYVRLPGDWEAYLKQLAPRMRTKIRSLIRELEQNHDVRYEECDGEADLDARLEDLFRLHELRWQGRNQHGVFSSPDKRRFYREMASMFLERGWLRFYSLVVDGHYVAHQFCFEYANTMFLLQEGFDPTCERLGVGNVLRAYVFRRCIDRGVSVYDFLGGVTQHKLSWGGDVKSSIRATAGRPTLKNKVYFALPKALEIGKEFAKAVLPERVLAWRRSLVN